MPFPPASETSGPVASLEFLPYERITQQDRDLEADAESSISERAGFCRSGIQPEQMELPAGGMPRAAKPPLFAVHAQQRHRRRERVFGFNPRDGDGRVRIIPILRRGYSLFSPAPINALDDLGFNHIRAEEHPAKAPDWLGTGLCYAALAGAKPEIGPPEETDFSQAPGCSRGKRSGSPSWGRRHPVYRCSSNFPAYGVDNDLQRQRESC